MARKDKNDSVVFTNFLKLDYKNQWGNYTNNGKINTALSRASKNKSGNAGFPDFIYVSEALRLLILVEVKPSISLHSSETGNTAPKKYAVDGIKHYLSFLTISKLKSKAEKEYFEHWKIVGIAVSGDLDDDYNHKISTYIILDNIIEEQKNVCELLNEVDYIHLFENIDEERIISEISATSKKINKWLRSVDSQKRPILLSALMICLFEVDGVQNDFRYGYNGWSPSTIIENIPSTVRKILTAEEIPEDKINLILSELGFLPHDQDLSTTDLLKDILNELRDIVIPLFSRKSNYDVIGKFYEEFLRYAGVANVKKGIVLTPKHITTLFTELVDIKINDVFLDPACGTGAFLIAAMNKLSETIESSKMSNKTQLIKNLKNQQLIGFEKNPTMYSLAISNMLFRGDGKSRIFYNDFFSAKALDELKELKKKHGIIPTIGFVNPPYGGKDNKDNPTKKEIQFLTRMLDQVSRYGIIIAPLSTYFKDDEVRNNILRKHTLKYVINMPKDLFMPNAAVNTAIAVFETNKPQAKQKTIFYDLKDDGFVLSKAKGRTDAYAKWNKIKRSMLDAIKAPDKYEDGLTVVQTNLQKGDEWLIQAHAKTDYSKLSNNSFVNSIKSYMIFKAKEDMDMIEEEVDEVTLLDVLSDYYS